MNSMQSLFNSLLILLSYYIVLTTSDIGYKVVLDEAVKDGARCLDGSPAVYYFADGTESRKYAIYFEGGGWCQSLDGCVQRTHNHLGSTLKDDDTIDLSTRVLLGDESASNPLFFNWNRVYVRYCDGGSFGSDRGDPIVINETKPTYLYFRGKRILDAVFESLIRDKGLGEATDIVIGGGSAGALAVYLHTNYIVDRFLDLSRQKVVALALLGFFLDYNGTDQGIKWSSGMQWVFTEGNLSSSTHDDTLCLNEHEESRCVFPQNMARFIKVPLFLTNSQYDSYQIDKILGADPNDTALINEYGRIWTHSVMDSFLNFSDEDSGVVYGAFIDSCHHHGASAPENWNSLYIDGYTAATAFQQFYEELDSKEFERTIWFQNVSYPCDTCCPLTTSPTAAPTTSPTAAPTTSPTAAPTTSPTASPTISVKDMKFVDWTPIVIGSAMTFLLILLFLVVIYVKRKRDKVKVHVLDGGGVSLKDDQQLEGTATQMIDLK